MPAAAKVPKHGEASTSKRPNRGGGGGRETLHKAPAVPPREDDVIVLSSDTEEDEPLSPRKAQPKKRRTGTTNLMPEVVIVRDAVATGEAKEAANVVKLRKELKKAQQEIQELKVSREMVQGELMAAKAEVKNVRDVGGNKKNLSSLEEQLCCEICTATMWAPYTLTECGHSFCASCLLDWFNTALAQHMQQHPNYVAEIVVPPHLLAMRHHPGVNEQIRQWVAIRRAAMPQPQYTCPSCRVQARAKPVEVYKLKEIVRTVATLNGEGSPRRQGRLNTNPFSGFFPDEAV
ncbi:hypothetical protein BD410DRAFT_788458 [Rickenella mellea]|uniref:RING-type domain-containing protein n=1 Tax=Rickenella mellea TaxID=50990 RepID=A0A4Y7Q4Q7_9AGAM|nr:hypothetical protein BD410DRAFT_788458 [Rickenella mellea]